MDPQIPAEKNNPDPSASPIGPQLSQLRQIRTFQGDVASALSGQNESLVSIQQAEAAKRRAGGIPEGYAEKQNQEEKKKDILFLSVGSAVLILVGLMGAWYGYSHYLKITAPPILAVPQNRFISSNRELALNVTGARREVVVEAFRKSVAEAKPGELVHVVLKTQDGATTKLLTTAQLFSLLESRAPGSLVRAFDPLFMIGSIGDNPFIIIRLKSFENAFAGMLNWEENMAEDLQPFFPNIGDLKANGSAAVFNDTIVKNKDVRVLETQPLSAETGSTTVTVSPQPVILYSFFDNNMLIITNKIETLQTLMDRLTKERLSR